jgi:hypothetical protein
MWCITVSQCRSTTRKHKTYHQWTLSRTIPQLPGTEINQRHVHPWGNLNGAGTTLTHCKNSGEDYKHFYRGFSRSSFFFFLNRLLRTVMKLTSLSRSSGSRTKKASPAAAKKASAKKERGGGVL